MSIRAESRSLFVVALVVLAVSVTVAAGGDAPWDAKRDYVFAQNAQGFRFEGTTLVLEKVPSTLFFAAGRYGQISNGDFARLWNEEPDSFSQRAPYAVLRMLEGDARAEILLELGNPRVQGTNISYETEIVGGSPAAGKGVCTLFIDASRAAPAPSPTAAAKEPINSRDRQARETIARFKQKDPGLDRFFKTAAGWAVFPSIAKGGFIVGGARGDGVVYANDQVIGYSTVTQGTIGLQIGGQAYSEIIFFEDEAALSHFKSGNAEFSAQASAVAVTAGASANAKYAAGVAIFTMAKGGAMLEASVGGQGFSFNER